jgi:hypothetical protein
VGILFTLSGTGHISTQLVEAHDLAVLSHQNPERLEGRPALFRVALTSTLGERNGFFFYDCQSPDDVNRTVWFYADQTLEEGRDEYTVEATLNLVKVPAFTFTDGTYCPEYWEYPLEHPVRR